MKYRNTKQRDLVLNFLQDHNGHYSAEQIYAGINQDNNISLATTYRNLAILEDMQKIKKIALPSGYVYDKTATPHYHFYCQKCGRLEDLDLPYDVKNINPLISSIKGEIQSHDIIINGVCEHCLKKSPK